MAAPIDPYHKWLGIPPSEQPPHHYRLLSIAVFEGDPDVIDAAANRQMSFLRECGEGPHSAASQRLLNEVSTARVVLLNRQKKAAYDSALRSHLAPPNALSTLQVAPGLPRRAPYGAIGVGIAVVSLVLALFWFSRPPAVVNVAASSNLTPPLALPPAHTRPIAAPTKMPRPAPPAPAERRDTLPVPIPPTPPDVKREPQAEGKSQPNTSVAEVARLPESKDPNPSTKTDPKIASAPDDETLAQAEPKKPELKSPRPPELLSARVPIPPKEGLVAAEKLIKELFKAEYASRKAEDRVALAKKLLSQGIETTDDPASQYVLLGEARDVAAALGETDIALGAVDQLCKQFDINSGEERFQTLSTLSRSTRTAEANQVLLDQSTRALDDSVDADDYELAKKLATLAGAVAKKAQNVKTIGLMANRLRELETLKKDYEAAKEAHTILKSNPDDEGANLIVGKFLCFSKGDFEKGLEHLAKGNDETLKALAERDLAKPKDATEQLALADQWWALGEKEREPAKGNIQQRAVPWYTEALPNLKGLTKTQVESKLKGKQSPGGSRKRALAELLMSTTWKVSVTHGTYPPVGFEPNGNWKCSGGTGTWARDGETVVVTFPTGAREVFKLVNGKILVDHYGKDQKTPGSTGFAIPWEQAQPPK